MKPNLARSLIYIGRVFNRYLIKTKFSPRERDIKFAKQALSELDL